MKTASIFAVLGIVALAPASPGGPAPADGARLGRSRLGRPDGPGRHPAGAGRRPPVTSTSPAPNAPAWRRPTDRVCACACRADGYRDRQSRAGHRHAVDPARLARGGVATRCAATTRSTHADPTSVTPAARISSSARQRAIQVDRPAGGQVHRDHEAQPRGIQRRPGDAEIRGQPHQRHRGDPAAAQIALQPGGRGLVVLEEGRVAVDPRPGTPCAGSGPPHRCAARMKRRARAALHAMRGPQHLRAVLHLGHRRRARLAGMLRGEGAMVRPGASPASARARRSRPSSR
jgi:hypothetical protein